MGNAMGAPRPGPRGTAWQTDAVGRRVMGSKTCMSPTIRHGQRTGARSQRKVVHRQRTQAVCRQRTSSAYRLHRHWPMMVHGLD